MKEELLHYIWQSRRLLANAMYTKDGKTLEILHPGIYNRDAGPDFFNAKVKIGDTTWAGNIEMHMVASDWMAHKHQLDPHYDNVILHVVYVADKPVHYSNGNEVPTLELKPILPVYLIKRYEQLMKKQTTVPCEDIMQLPDRMKLELWLTRLLTERMADKTDRLRTLLNEYQQNWEEAFYIFIARYFGMKTNSEPFEWLARNLPLRILGRHKNNLLHIRALLFGVSGMIGQKGHENLQSLAAESEVLMHKYNLTALQPHVWKFSRTRPANFPDVRLEQFALLIHHASHLFSKSLDADDVQSLIALYEMKGEKKPHFTRDTIHLLLINAVLPAMFLYGKSMQQPDLCEKAIQYYDEIPAEKNKITRYWSAKGINIKTAAHSQAVIQLNRAYCEQVKCLSCTIGHYSLWQ
jgi:hypothetical protein